MATISKNSIVATLLIGSLCCFIKPAKSQVTLPEIITGDVVDGIKGTTVNRSVQAGSKSAVSFGSSTTFGTSSSINTTSGAYGASESQLQLNTTGSETCPTGGCISSSVGGDNGITNADIANIRSTTDASSNSSGNVNLSGIQASNELILNGGLSNFRSQVHTIHDSNSPGDSLFENNPNIINVAGDSQNASANSNTLINTNTNIDINTTEFTSTFQQAF